MALFSGTKSTDPHELLAKGDVEGAVKAFRRAIVKTPDDFALGVKYGETLERSGRRDDAAAEFVRVADIQEAKGHHSKALALYRRAEKLAPGRQDLKAKIASQASATSSSHPKLSTAQKKTSTDDAFDIDMDRAEPEIEPESEPEIGDATLSTAMAEAVPDDDYSAEDLPPVVDEVETLPEAEMEMEVEVEPEVPEPEPVPAPPAPKLPASKTKTAPSHPAISTADLLAASEAAEGGMPALRGILSDLTAGEVALLTGRFKSLHREPGETIIVEGEKGESMYFIRSGLVKVATDTPAGLLVLGELTPGDYFGEVSLLKKVQRTATISALEVTELYELERTALDELRPKIPNLLERLEEGLNRRAHDTIEAIQKKLAGD